MNSLSRDVAEALKINEKAHAQGWIIIGHPLVITCTLSGPFKTNKRALDFVKAQATAGDKLAVKAIALITKSRITNE